MKPRLSLLDPSFVYTPSHSTSIAKTFARVRRLAVGMSNKQIGRKLGIADGTVRFHVMRIFEKCSVNNRTQAALVIRGAQ